MLTYRLSNRQRSEYLLRQSWITIAIPIHPADLDKLQSADPRTLREWAWGRLDATELHQIRSAEVRDLFTRPSPSDGLTGLLGAICDAMPDADVLATVVPAVVVELSATANPRHRPPQIQWPVLAHSDRGKWPAKYAEGQGDEK